VDTKLIPRKRTRLPCYVGYEILKIPRHILTPPVEETIIPPTGGGSDHVVHQVFHRVVRRPPAGHEPQDTAKDNHAGTETYK